ncbi:MAG: APC family permease [Deltaproteobacteria bacterium]|nr:APC family permease [Deltaproteobacteria bacterium]
MGQGNQEKRLRRRIFGAPKSLSDAALFHKISLIPILAWIGLGADGLSSSAYGPEEAFKALGAHTYLALILAAMTAFTVFVISYAYSRIIEHFPYGGGGYIVATHMLGEKPGVVSGSALLVDYVLTITVSISSCADAIFSFLPLNMHIYKVPFAAFLILFLIVLNIRGVKESIAVLAPIFIVFILSHMLMLFDGLYTHSDQFGLLLGEFRTNLKTDLSTIGIAGVLALILRAYSLGGGTYTGIEAVSNGMQIMREPRVQTGKRTMAYMAISLAFTAGVLFISYQLIGVSPVEGRTLNAVLADALFLDWPMGGAISFITIFSEGALLLVAAQAGFMDGPRVMANMAIDSWFPHRFSALSERLSMQNGIVLMGASAIALLIYTKGSVSALIVMYSINVFVTFSLSQLGMTRLYFQRRKADRAWLRHLTVHVVGFVLCVTILIVTSIEKFREGGWITLVITSAVIGACYTIKSHYRKVEKGTAQLDEMLLNMPVFGPVNTEPVNPRDMTSVILVSGYNGFGIHTLLSTVTNFPQMKNIIFVSVAVIDSGTFKGAEEMERLEASVKESLGKYVTLARKLGFPADYRMDAGTDVVESAERLCKDISREFTRMMVFTGQLTFRLEKFYHRMLHNETAFAIQRRLQWSGITTVILPIRVRV